MSLGKEKNGQSLGLLLAITTFPTHAFEGHWWTQQGTLSYLNHKELLEWSTQLQCVLPCTWWRSAGVDRNDCRPWFLEKHTSM